VAHRLRTRLDAIAARFPAVGEVRGAGAMLALELVEPEPELARAITAAAFERGLILLTCGIYGNVIRLLPPLAASDDELERGLDVLEESLGDAGAAAA
jgi:4-aminobutyrate aminotransferase-like enzyme